LVLVSVFFFLLDIIHAYSVQESLCRIGKLGLTVTDIGARKGAGDDFTASFFGQLLFFL
jgi:hypothetical protein